MMRTQKNTFMLLLLVFYFYGVTGSNDLTNLAGRDPACSVVPKWDICKYHYVSWQREYRWRAYYNPEANDCYYYRGCPDNNQDLFTYDVDCREACVTGEDRKMVGSGRPAQCFQRPKFGRCDKKVKRFWFDKTDSKCKMFLSCEHMNKKYWKSPAACYRSCYEGMEAKQAKDDVVTDSRNKKQLLGVEN